MIINPKTVVFGSYRPIIQSILDFDFLAKKKEPSIKYIISANKKFEKFFWGKEEILIPVSSKPERDKSINSYIDFSSGRRVLANFLIAKSTFPNLKIGTIFAENVAERHSLEIYNKKGHLTIIGPASVGLVIPNKIKLGAIGGVNSKQITAANLFKNGKTAIISTSGGMINELINMLATKNIPLSFALALGGDRFPITSPKEALLLAQKDSNTKQIIYFGELGGTDEYEIAKLLKKQVTKPVIGYIAGSIAEIFKEPVQFGHAKALAKNKEETARAKREALVKAGAKIGRSYKEFISLIKKI